MGDIAFLVLVGIIIVAALIRTLRVVIHDDPGKRPTREMYDSRTPE